MVRARLDLRRVLSAGPAGACASQTVVDIATASELGQRAGSVEGWEREDRITRRTRDKAKETHFDRRSGSGGLLLDEQVSGRTGGGRATSWRGVQRDRHQSSFRPFLFLRCACVVCGCVRACVRARARARGTCADGTDPSQFERVLRRLTHAANAVHVLRCPFVSCAPSRQLLRLLRRGRASSPTRGWIARTAAASGLCGARRRLARDTALTLEGNVDDDDDRAQAWVARQEVWMRETTGLSGGAAAAA